MALAEHEVPRTFEDIPPDIGEFIRQTIIRRNLAIHETPPDLFKWLFLGRELAGRHVHYGMAPRDIWVLIIEESKRWHAARAIREPAGVGA